MKDRLGYLARLVADDRLEIRIAIPHDDRGVPTGEIYHEKLGARSRIHQNSGRFAVQPLPRFAP